mmetsp:Transcript_8018/g.49539  ORF Transcript_8018/g.49539 Transcript_8018/m.49539 type:complete len:223 (+) Transcript_8018:3449-4117(+)
MRDKLLIGQCISRIHQLVQATSLCTSTDIKGGVTRDERCTVSIRSDTSRHHDRLLRISIVLSRHCTSVSTQTPIGSASAARATVPLQPREFTALVIELQQQIGCIPSSACSRSIVAGKVPGWRHHCALERHDTCNFWHPFDPLQQADTILSSHVQPRGSLGLHVVHRQFHARLGELVSRLHIAGIDVGPIFEHTTRPERESKGDVGVLLNTARGVTRLQQST